MDRNKQCGDGRQSVAVVALRKESVDRNHQPTGISVIGDPSLSARRAWIEIARCCGQRHLLQSLSARRAWIEMETMLPSWTRYAVALRKESVDRNLRLVHVLECSIRSLSARRAWIEIWARHTGGPQKWSLSARRAWIEISKIIMLVLGLEVALRKESVDRNARASSLAIRSCGSLSARRAWIEMPGPAPWRSGPAVALRKESVDRNSGLYTCTSPPYVALRKESVDRNI